MKSCAKGPPEYHVFLTATIAHRSLLEPHSAFHVLSTGVISPGSFKGFGELQIWSCEKHIFLDASVSCTVHGGRSLLHLIHVMSLKLMVFVAAAVITYRCDTLHQTGMGCFPNFSNYSFSYVSRAGAPHMGKIKNRLSPAQLNHISSAKTWIWTKISLFLWVYLMVWLITYIANRTSAKSGPIVSPHCQWISFVELNEGVKGAAFELINPLCARGWRCRVSVPDPNEQSIGDVACTAVRSPDLVWKQAIVYHYVSDFVVIILYKLFEQKFFKIVLRKERDFFGQQLILFVREIFCNRAQWFFKMHKCIFRARIQIFQFQAVQTHFTCAQVTITRTSTRCKYSDYLTKVGQVIKTRGYRAENAEQWRRDHGRHGCVHPCSRHEELLTLGPRPCDQRSIVPQIANRQKSTRIVCLVVVDASAVSPPCEPIVYLGKNIIKVIES